MSTGREVKAKGSKILGFEKKQRGVNQAHEQTHIVEH